MTPNDAFYATVHDYPGGCESLAPRLLVLQPDGAHRPMSPAVLRNKANPNTATNHPTLSEVDRVMGLTGDYRILHALAGNHSHVCMAVDANTAPSDLAVLELVTHVWRAHGSVGAAVDAALADGRIERHEVEQIRTAIYNTIKALNQMLVRIEHLMEPGHTEGGQP